MKLQHIKEKSIETHNGENVYKQRNSNILQMRTKINIYVAVDNCSMSRHN